MVCPRCREPLVERRQQVPRLHGVPGLPAHRTAALTEMGRAVEVNRAGRTHGIIP